MPSVDITHEAQAAILEHAGLLGIARPALLVRRIPASGEVTRADDGRVRWQIERPSGLVCQFFEVPAAAEPDDRVVSVQGISVLLSGEAVLEASVTLFVKDGELHVEASPVVQGSAGGQSHEMPGPSPQRIRGVPVGVRVCQEVTALSETHRLRLCQIAVSTEGFYFHSLQWDVQKDNDWHRHLVLTQEQFEAGQPNRRFVSSLHSLDPSEATAIIKVGESDRPKGGSHAILYSWREWSLRENFEVRRLKNCRDGHEGLD